jgi:hypothetical protein
MNFAQLYTNNRHAVTRALTAMWCGETNNASQEAYVKQLKETVIPELFAPKDAIPVAQCMNLYKSVFTVSTEQAKSIVGELWKSEYAPFEHQYQCWNTLLNEKTQDGKPKSICVTTGTGSGKTECFMIPLIYDLLQNPMQDKIQAIFLYPLNALMEDQKERMEEFLEGTNLWYTVYNGDLPEDEPANDDHSEEANRLRHRIAQIRGEYVQDGETKYRFPHMVYTRRMVRNNPPNIVLTNPTMLEYILLRAQDRFLIDPYAQSLRWVAIDETHSYNGAGAAEIAMLLRRVLIAFNVQASDIRFATSSATFGNGADPEKEKEELQEFIAGITGVRKDQVAAIGGERIGQNEIPENQDKEKWKLIFHKDFVSLSDLFPGTVEEQLHLLDEMCQRAEGSQMKVKVHYFHRVPNNGLFVRLNEHENGAFKIYDKNIVAEDEVAESPLLELSRCKQCGEYLALARITLAGENLGKYEAVEADESDIFDLEEPNEDYAEKKYAVIGLAATTNRQGDNNLSLIYNNGKLDTLGAGQYPAGSWHLVANTHSSCPYCSSKLSKGGGQDADSDNLNELDSGYLKKFRFSADFISRIMAPSILEQLEKKLPSDSDNIILHEGQQYLSFADSRQMAARATMKQNLVQERMWVYSTIFHALCKKKADVEKNQEKIKELGEKLPSLSANIEESLNLLREIERLQSAAQLYLTWDEIAQFLLTDKHCEKYAQYFVKRSGDSDELDDNGKIPSEMLYKYVQSIMVMYLSSRPSTAASPETLGLFHACYPQLLKIKELPEAVIKFNNSLNLEENRISIEDWRNYLQIFMDYIVRSNQSVFLKIPNNNQIDIFACNRFATEKPRRRPATMPVLEENHPSNSRVVLYLTTMLAKDKGIASPNDAYKQYFGLISGVIRAMWDCLTRSGSELLEHSQKLNDKGTFEKDRDDENTGANRLNLYNLCFKLYDGVYLCDANTKGGDRHVISLRPISNNFKKFSPYLSDSSAVLLQENHYEKWELYPNYIGCGKETNLIELKDWAKANRKLLWNNSLWGEEGVFSDRLFDIYLGPKLFIQAEHTAQVDKNVARQLQADFKNGKINILACSTTMEMGVNLGNLEVVMMTSVPPQPSNYKQRAGRSGRNNKIRSAAITLCGSDAIGLRTLFSPIESIISRPVNVPRVDLKSPQVIQRHVNSFLIRTFGVFDDGNQGGNINQRVLNYYTPFSFTREGRRLRLQDANGLTVDPPGLLGEPDKTPYETFNILCGSPLNKQNRTNLAALLKETIYEDQIQFVVRQASKDNERCYSELRKKLQGFSYSFDQTANDKFRSKLRLQHMEVLNTRLLEYWATSRFTPNANMPVNIISLNLNSSGKIDFFTPQTLSNPSYSLREAISQYAPGNRVVVDGVAYIVRGVEYTNLYNDINTFKQIYRNALKTVIDEANTIDSKITWTVNKKEGLELVQPIGFLPDINEDGGRVLDNNKFTRVSAQLIDTDEWKNKVTEPLLFSVRKNLHSGNAKILYYNEGVGYGYCMCTRCGRMVLEDAVAEDPLEKLPADFNILRPSNPQRPKYHHAISGKDYKKACSGSTSRDYIRRNVIIGDLIQTDYSEIRIRKKGQNQWMGLRNERNEKLLFTLGIVFCQALVETLGKERSAVDFTIMPNAHICIFDTNPGGAGYANQLEDYSIMKQIIDNAKEILLKANRKKSKDMLLDKFTLRYQKYVDVDGALAWIEDEQSVREIIPAEIDAIFPRDDFKTEPVTLSKLKNAFENSVENLTLFVQDNYNTWDYMGDENGWFGQLFSHFNKHPKKTTFCIIEYDAKKMPEPILDMIRSIKGWASRVTRISTPYAGEKIFPLAYIDGKLYFTNEIENATLDSMWGRRNIFTAKIKDFAISATEVDTTYRQNTCIFKLAGSDSKTIKTKEYGHIIQQSSNELISQFIEYCKKNPDEIIIKYQDEHLKSILGIITTLQIIDHIVKQTECDFTLEFLVEKYDDFNYRTGIANNLPSDKERDKILEQLTNKWIDSLDNISGNLVEIKSKDRRSLTHWRVLSMTCRSTTLSIYPDGGFINGWILDRSAKTKNPDENYPTTEDNISIIRIQDIKFDVCLETDLE